MATGIRGEQIKDESIDSVDIASGSIRAGELSPEAISGQNLITVTDISNDKLLVWDATDSNLKQVSIEDLGVTAAAAGSDGQVQYNNGGSAMAGSSGIYWDDINNRVGVGTTSPSQELHVYRSDGDATLRIESGDGNGELNLKGSSGNSAWIYQPASTDELRFYTEPAGGGGGDDRLTILGSGHVGVGTTTPKTGLDIHHSPASLADNTGGGECVTFGTGVTVVGKLYYLNGTAWAEIDASAPATGADQMVGIALGTSSAGGILIRGFFDATTYLSSFSAGKAVYMSETAASMTTVVPTTTGAIVRIMGYCTDTANVIYFNPSNNWIELA